MSVKKLAVIAIFAVCFSSSNSIAQNRELGSAGNLIEGIAAIVDEGVVLRSELDFRMRLVIESMREQQSQLPPEQRGQLPPMAALQSQVLEQLVLTEIQLQRAARIGIVIGDDILNQALAQVAEGLGITLEELPAKLESEGLDYYLYREDTRNDIALSQLEQRDVYSRIRVAPRELDQCLARVNETQSDEFDFNISHILISVSGNASSDELDEARDQAISIVNQLDNDADFSQLAVAYSDGPTALEGGALGWRKGSELPTIFADAIPQMKANEVSDIIQTGSGFHIVRVNDVRGVERAMVDQVRARHILVSPNEILDDDATEQKLLGIYNQIQSGDDFATLALTSSEDTVSAADGGDLGWNAPDVFVPEFSEVLTSLEVGQMSKPFRSRFGWHILEVTDSRSYDNTDELKEQGCIQEIRASKAEEERQLWLQQLRDQNYVDIRL